MTAGQRLVIAQINTALHAKQREVKDMTREAYGWSVPQGGLLPGRMFYYHPRGRVSEYPAELPVRARYEWLTRVATVVLDSHSDVPTNDAIAFLRDHRPSDSELAGTAPYFIAEADRTYHDWLNEVSNLRLLGNQIGQNLPASTPYARLAPQSWLAMSDAERLVRAGGNQTVKNVVDGYMHDMVAPRATTTAKAPALRPAIRATGQVTPTSDVTPPVTAGMSKTTISLLSLAVGAALGAGAVWFLMVQRLDAYEQAESDRIQASRRGY